MNNKGFAISGILYGVLILFLTILLSILGIMVDRINRLSALNEEISKSVEEVGYTVPDLEEAYKDSTTNFTTKIRGKYEILLNQNSNNKCYAYLPKNIMIYVLDNKLQYATPNEEGKIDLNDLNANNLNLLKEDGTPCTNASITSFRVNKVYSTIYKTYST